VDWQKDVCDPTYQPLPGQRVWVDMTQERAMEFARRKVARFWDSPSMPMSDFYPDKQTAIEALWPDIWHNGEAPDLIEWPDAPATPAQPATVDNVLTSSLRSGELDWTKAQKHLEIIEVVYGRALQAGVPNLGFALGFIASARKRFDEGERTADLHEEIMGLEE
jgi:hypothetical protein